MATRLRLTSKLHPGEVMVFDCATFFDRFRPGADTRGITLGADAIETVEVVSVPDEGVAVEAVEAVDAAPASGGATPSEAPPAQAEASEAGAPDLDVAP
jgi:hypothetical protein